MDAELVIRGGVVIDGTGAPGRRADVAVSQGRVAAIGEGLRGERTLDATGHVVAPGFIDIHTHYDAQVFWDPALTPSCFHGVTTVVAGNCGFSIAPTRVEHRELIVRTLENVEDMNAASLTAGVSWDFTSFPEYLASVGRRGTALNFAAYIGHTALRLFVMGQDAYERAAQPHEVEQMQAVLREAMLAGAAGFATSFATTHRGAEGKPVPSRLADQAELHALLEVMRELGRGVVAFAPGPHGPGFLPGLYALQQRVGVPFTYGALLTSPAGTHKMLLELNDAGWAAGARVWPQVTPRPLVFSMTMDAPFVLNVNTQLGTLMAGSIEQRRRAYADPAWRKQALEAWAEQPPFLMPRWDTYEIAESPSHPSRVGRRLTEIAAESGGEPFLTLLDLALDEPELALRVRCIVANDDPDGVAQLLAQEHCTLGLSDAGAHVSQLCDAPQATDLLGNWVRERGVLTLEQAVRKLSGVQADLMGFADRGYLRPGACADVVVFDPETVAPGPLRRVRDFPADAERITADQPIGVRHVLVNGVAVRVDGVQAGRDVRPGRVIGPTATA
jgi:N-acyl-D-amino-acid deacylase